MVPPLTRRTCLAGNVRYLSISGEITGIGDKARGKTAYVGPLPSPPIGAIAQLKLLKCMPLCYTRLGFAP